MRWSLSGRQHLVEPFARNRQQPSSMYMQSRIQEQIIPHGGVRFRKPAVREVTEGQCKQTSPSNPSVHLVADADCLLPLSMLPPRATHFLCVLLLLLPLLPLLLLLLLLLLLRSQVSWTNSPQRTH